MLKHAETYFETDYDGLVDLTFWTTDPSKTEHYIIYISSVCFESADCIEVRE